MHKQSLLPLFLLLASTFLVSLQVLAQKSPGKIVGGRDADISETPWQVALLTEGQGTQFERQFCGGSIIDEYWILTAAHCVTGLDPSQLQVIAGISDLDANPATNSDVQVMEVTQIISHPGYVDGLSFENDVALLRLATPIDLSGSKASAVPLLTETLAAEGVADPGKIGIVSGWGNTAAQGTSYPTQLQVAEVEIIGNEQANAANSYNGLVTDSMVAAGNFEEGGVDVCQGDSGGPLVVRNQDDDGWLLAGITSWGFGCAQPELPGIYARVSSYEVWIRENSGVGLPPQERPDFGIELLDDNFQAPPTRALCSGTIITVFETALVVNEGKEPINEVQFRYLVGTTPNDLQVVRTENYQFPTPLLSGNSAFIDIEDAIVDALGAVYARLEVLPVDPGQEDNPANNIIDRSFDVVDGESFTLIVRPDNFPEEISWRVVDLEGNVVYEPQGIGNISSNDSLEQRICLPEGQFILRVEDSFADGLIPPAYVRVVENVTGNETELLNLSGNYGAGGQVLITVPFTGELAADIAPLSEEIINCGDATVQIRMTVSNKGQIPVERIGLSLDDTDEPTVQQELNIPAGDSAQVILSLGDPSASLDAVQVTLVELNGSPVRTPDENDRFRVNVIRPERTITPDLTIRTDDFPEENSWEIRNAETGDILVSVPVIEEASAIINTDFCAVEGCYVFRLNDSFGDGVSVGTVAQLNVGQQVIFSIEEPGNYSQQVRNFCLLNAPENLQITSAGSDSVLLTWTDNSAIETGYEVEVVEQGGSSTTLQFSADAESGGVSGLNRGSTYTFSVSAFNDTGVSEAISETVSVTSLSGKPWQELEVYPNPTQGLLMVNGTALEHTQQLQLGIYDLSGKLQRQLDILPVQGQAAPVELNGLKDGFYLLKVELQEGVRTFKILKH